MRRGRSACRLTFELSRAQRRGAWPVRRMICIKRCTGQVPCRCASALERGVRPHSRLFVVGGVVLFTDKLTVPTGQVVLAHFD